MPVIVHIELNEYLNPQTNIVRVIMEWYSKLGLRSASIIAIVLLMFGCTTSEDYRRAEQARYDAMSAEEQLNYKAEKAFRYWDFDGYVSYLEKGADVICSGFLNHPTQVEMIKSWCPITEGEEATQALLDDALFSLSHLGTNVWRNRGETYEMYLHRDSDLTAALLAAGANPNKRIEMERKTNGSCSYLKYRATAMQCASYTLADVHPVKYKRFKMLLLAGGNPALKTNLKNESGQFNSVDILRTRVEELDVNYNSRDEELIANAFNLFDQVGASPSRSNSSNSSWLDFIFKAGVTATVGVIAMDSGASSSDTSRVLSATLEDVWGSGEGNALSSLYQKQLSHQLSVQDPALAQLIYAQEDMNSAIARKSEQVMDFPKVSGEPDDCTKPEFCELVDKSLSDYDFTFKRVNNIEGSYSFNDGCYLASDKGPLATGCQTEGMKRYPKRTTGIPVEKTGYKISSCKKTEGADGKRTFQRTVTTYCKIVPTKSGSSGQVVSQ